MSWTLSRELLRLHATPTFVETGTNHGDCVEMAMEVGFSRVLSVEKDPLLYRYARRRFAGDTRVSIYGGDSAQLLPLMLSALVGPATFWLDGHDNKPGGCPLLAELDLILPGLHSGSRILIDDLRCWNYWGVSEDAVRARLASWGPDVSLEVAENCYGLADILVARRGAGSASHA